MCEAACGENCIAEQKRRRRGSALLFFADKRPQWKDRSQGWSIHRTDKMVKKVANRPGAEERKQGGKVGKVESK